MPPLENTHNEAVAQFVGLARDLLGYAGLRLIWVALAAVVAAVAQGVGLLLLVPLLSLLGITGSPGAVSNLVGQWAGPISLETALVVYVGLVAAATLIVNSRNLATLRLRFGYVDDLRRRLHRALTAMEWQAFSQLRGADVIRILTAESAEAALAVQFLLSLGAWAIEVAVLVAVATKLSPVMTAAVLALAVLAALVARPLNRRTHQLGAELGESGKTWQAVLSDDIAGMHLIRAFSMGAARHVGFSQCMKSVRLAQIAYFRAVGIANTLTRTGAAVAVAVALIVATRGLGLALADTLVLIMVYMRLLSTLMGAQEGWRAVLHALPAHAATTALLRHCQAWAEPAAADPDPDSELEPALTRGISLIGVGYRHRDDRPPALAGISADIPARRVTALVGPSGAGKSTLADVLLGLIVPREGRILVDGIALEGALRHRWRRRVGYVPQDGFFFHDTIRANLLAVAPGASEEALWRVLEQAAAAGFVRRLPHQLDTVVGDRGARFSGGERQRLALARALLVEPELLVLDEATSALDAGNECQILDALDRLRGELTIVVIAHRPSTVAFADYVLRLDHGRLVPDVAGPSGGRGRADPVATA